MNIKEVKLYKKYLHKSTNSIVEVLNIDVDTNNVFIRKFSNFVALISDKT